MNSPSITLAAVRALQNNGIAVRANDGSAVGGRRSVTVHVGSSARTYTVETRPRMGPGVAAAIDVPPGPPLLVIAPVIGDESAGVLRARGIDFADTTGNVRLAWDGVLVDVRGRRPPRGTPARRPAAAARAFTRSGAQVIFALLAWDDAVTLPLRELARVGGVSLGTAQIVVDDLLRGGLLVSGPDGRAVARGGELLSRWTEAYVVSLASKLSLASYTVPDARWWDGADLAEDDVQIGGDLAAGFVDATGRSSTTLYAERLPAALVARHRMQRDDANGTVHVRRRFWRPEERAGGDDAHLVSAPLVPAPVVAAPLVPAPLVYADLIASGDPDRRAHADLLRARDPRLAQLDGT